MENNILHNDDVERSVLAALIMNNENYYRADGRLKADLFVDVKNKELFNAIMTIMKNEQVADIISISMFFMKQKRDDSWEPSGIAELSSCIATDVTFMQNVLILCDLYERRRCWAFGQKLIRSGMDLSVSTNEIKTELTDFLNAAEAETSGVFSMADANTRLLKRVEENMNNTGGSSIPTGFSMIDNVSGFQGTDFNVIAAESSQGKTTWLINILVNAATAGVPSVIYSLEMNAMQLSARINSARCNLSSSTIQYKQLTEQQYQQVRVATEETSKFPIFFDDNSTSSFESIVESIHTIARKGEVKIFAIDYLQILCSTGNIQNQELFLGKVARELKNLAKKYNVCVIALSQLRKSMDDPFPTLERLRGSGQIRDAADNIFFIYRPEMYKKSSYKDFPNIKDVSGTAEIIWAKGRNTGTNECVVGFNAMRMEFHDKEFDLTDYPTHEDRSDAFAFSPPKKGALPF